MFKSWYSYRKQVSMKHLFICRYYKAYTNQYAGLPKIWRAEIDSDGCIVENTVKNILHWPMWTLKEIA